MGKLRSKKLAVLTCFAESQVQREENDISLIARTSTRFSYVVDWSFSSLITQICGAALILKTTSSETRVLISGFKNFYNDKFGKIGKCFLPHILVLRWKSLETT